MSPLASTVPARKVRMKTTPHVEKTPSRPASPVPEAAHAASPPRSSGSALQQRAVTSAQAGLPAAIPRRASAEALPDASEHSAATIQRSNARPRARTISEVVQVRLFDVGAPARSHSGDGEMPLRNVARQREPSRPAPPSRWNSEPAQRGAPVEQARAPRRAPEADAAPAAGAPAPRDAQAAAPRMPVRRPDPDDAKSV